MTRKYLAILFVFVETAVHALANEKQGYVEQDFRTNDAFNDPRYSSTIAAHEGYRLFTNIPGQGLTESLTLTHSDGLFVAGQKVSTVNEVSAVQQAITHELQAMRRQLQVLVDREIVQERESPTSNNNNTFNSSCTTTVQHNAIPNCTAPGGKYLQHNGTQWVCVCEVGYEGSLCKSPTQGCPTGWSSFNGYCYWISDEKAGKIYAASWTDARDVCLSFGADHVSIHSQEEHRFVASLSTPACQASSSCIVWMGLSNLRWTDGSPYDYQAWEWGEQNCASCATFRPHYALAINSGWGGWGGAYQPFICKRPSS